MSSSNQRPANRGFRSVLRYAISHYRQVPSLSAPEPELMAGADRAIAWFRNHGKRGAKMSLHPKRGGLAAAAKQRALRGKSASARNWVQGVRY